jgi:hypothetical protein
VIKHVTAPAAAAPAVKTSPLKPKPAWDGAERRSAARATNVSRLPAPPKAASQTALPVAKAANGGDDEWESF